VASSSAFTVAWEKPEQFSKVLSHIGSFTNIRGGHAYTERVLASEKRPIRIFLCDGRNDNRGFRNGVSLDQVAAEQVGNVTRYPSLTLCVTGESGPTLSFTRSGAPIPPEKSPRKLFQKLFVQGKPSEVEANVEAIRQGRSMLDFVGEQSKRLNRSLSKADQQRIYGELSGAELRNPDFVSLAHAFGVDGYRVHTPRELERVLDAAIEKDAPAVVVVEMPLDASVSPWGFLMPPSRLTA